MKYDIKIYEGFLGAYPIIYYDKEWKVFNPEVVGPEDFDYNKLTPEIMAKKSKLELKKVELSDIMLINYLFNNEQLYVKDFNKLKNKNYAKSGNKYLYDVKLVTSVDLNKLKSNKPIIYKDTQSLTVWTYNKSDLDDHFKDLTKPLPKNKIQAILVKKKLKDEIVVDSNSFYKKFPKLKSYLTNLEPNQVLVNLEKGIKINKEDVVEPNLEPEVSSLIKVNKYFLALKE